MSAIHAKHLASLMSGIDVKRIASNYFRCGATVGRCMTVRLVSAAVALLAGSSLASAQLMTAPGGFQVSSSGAANYSMPIAVPPGTAGLKPALTLDYSSQNQNGILGMGWA